MVLDQFGREVKTTQRPETREVAAVAVRDRFSMYPADGLTPAKLASIFKEADGGEVYRQAELFEAMEERDTHLSSVLGTRKGAVTGLDYEVVPYSDSAEDKKISEFCGDVIYNLDSFEEMLLDLLDALGKGFACSEIAWDVTKSEAVITGLEWVHQKRFTFMQQGANAWEKLSRAPKVLTEDNPAMGEELPPWKFVYHRHKARSGYDTRAGILRVASWMYLFKNYGIKDWLTFSEVYGMPLRVGKYDPNASKEDKKALKTAIQSLGSDAAGIISKSTEIEFIESSKTGKDPYEVLANWCDRQMSKAVLGQTLTTEVGDKGSYAASQTHDGVRFDLKKSDAEALSRTLRGQMLRPLVGFNYGWDKPLPWFKFKYKKSEDLVQLSTVYTNVQGMGFPVTQEHISERFDIPLPQKTETILSPPVVRGPTGFSAPPMKWLPLSAPEETPDITDEEALADEALRMAEASYKKMLGPVREIVDQASSLEEARDKLMDIQKEMDPGEFQEILAQAMFVVAVKGRMDVEQTSPQRRRGRKE